MDNIQAHVLAEVYQGGRSKVKWVRILIPAFVALSLAAQAEDVVESQAEPATEKTEEKGDEASPAEENPQKRRNLRSFSAAVNVLRQGSRVEAVFRNGDIYVLPRGSRQHAIFNALAESEKSGKAVSVTVDERTGVIESVGTAAKPGEKK